jgi:hypothetical protein
MILIFSELWSLVLNYNTGDVELYKELKSIYADKWLESQNGVSCSTHIKR